MLIKLIWHIVRLHDRRLHVYTFAPCHVAILDIYSNYPHINKDLIVFAYFAS